MKKYKIINTVFIVAVIAITVIPMLLLWQNIGITKYSIPAICLSAFHVIYGGMAYALRHKKNYLPYSVRFIKHFAFNLFEPNKDYTYTKEYKTCFYRMLAVYFAVVPMYIPCIFLSSTAFAMPLAVIVFLIPQAVFITFQIRSFSAEFKMERQKREFEEQQRKEQEKREEMGQWK